MCCCVALCSIFIFVCWVALCCVVCRVVSCLRNGGLWCVALCYRVVICDLSWRVVCRGCFLVLCCVVFCCCALCCVVS